MLKFVFALLLLPLRAWIFQVSWNYLMPELFHLSALTFWQACVALVIIGFFHTTTYNKSEK